MRTAFVVFETPAFQDNARFAQIAEEFAVKAFIAQLGVKALNMPVFRNQLYTRSPYLPHGVAVILSILTTPAYHRQSLTSHNSTGSGLFALTFARSAQS